MINSMAKKQDNPRKPVYVIYGKDSFLVNKRLEALLDELLSPEERDMALVSCDPDRTEAATVLDELRTLPFLADRKVVLLRDADKFLSANSDLLLKYFDSPARNGVLLLTLSSLRSNTKIAKKLASAGQVEKINELRKGDMAGFAAQVAKNEFGKKLSANAARMVVEYAGDDVSMISNEIAKLSVYAGDAPEITPADITALCGSNRNYDVFNVIDAMTAGRTDEAVRRLRNMFSSDKDAEYTVVGAFAFHFRRMFRARAMMDRRIAPPQIASELRIYYGKEQFFSNLSVWNLRTIAEVIKALARIDYESKTGRARVPVEVEQLVVKAAIRKRRG